MHFDGPMTQLKKIFEYVFVKLLTSSKLTGSSAAHSCNVVRKHATPKLHHNQDGAESYFEKYC